MSGSETQATQYTGVLDARLFDPLERLPRVLQSLQALSPGETLLLITAGPPQRLQAYLQSQGQVPVSVAMVKAGPPVWQTCLRRE